MSYVFYGLQTYIEEFKISKKIFCGSSFFVLASLPSKQRRCRATLFSATLANAPQAFSIRLLPNHSNNLLVTKSHYQATTLSGFHATRLLGY